jgi:hypothetical protein
MDAAIRTSEMTIHALNFETNAKLVPGGSR